MSEVKIYHNPRCSKSRATLELLRQNGVDPEVVEYLKDPPSAEELVSLLEMLRMEPRELARQKEADYAAAGLDDASLSRDEVIAKMVENPIVIERPIVVRGNRAAIGRPPEKVLDIL